MSVNIPRKNASNACTRQAGRCWKESVTAITAFQKEKGKMPHSHAFPQPNDEANGHRYENGFLGNFDCKILLRQRPSLEGGLQQFEPDAFCLLGIFAFGNLIRYSHSVDG